MNSCNCTEFIEYLPHEEALGLAAKSSALLLLLNNTPNKMGIIPGKTFEYLALRKPIICIGPTNGCKRSEYFLKQKLVMFVILLIRTKHKGSNNLLIFMISGCIIENLFLVNTRSYSRNEAD
jgi:hypothetical protein